MKPKHMFLPVMLFSSVLLHAQSVVDSAVHKLKTQQELKTVDKVNDKVSDKVSQGIDQLFDHPFKKKNKNGDKNAESDAATFQVGTGKSIITITNTDYSSLSSFSEALKSNSQVKEVKKEFSNGVGTLKVTHSGLADQVLDDLLKRADGRLDVVGIDGGKLNLKMK